MKAEAANQPDIILTMTNEEARLVKQVIGTFSPAQLVEHHKKYKNPYETTITLDAASKVLNMWKALDQVV